MGIDLVSVAAVREALERHGARYLRRVYSSAELARCQGPDGPAAERLARCFAAKEATFKALRSGDAAFAQPTIELLGGDRLRLGGDAARMAARRGLTGLSAATSSCGDQACAVVVARWSA